MTAFIDSFHLLRPWALLLLLPALGLWWAARNAADTTRRWSKAIDPHLLKLLTVGGEGRRSFGPHDLLLAGTIVIVLAIAGPTWRREPSPVAEGRAPVMVVLRVTTSMTTPDLAPTRLDRARQKLADLLKANDGMPVGLIAYSGSAHLVLPPTQDAGVVVTMAQALAPDIMPRAGDRLADAVTLAAGVLKEGGKGGSILVVADTAASSAIKATEGAPVVILAMAPAPAVEADASLAAAVSSLGATLVETTPDDEDVQTISRHLERDAAVSALTEEAAPWQEAGWGLTPLVAVIVLLWFRRGWVLPA